MMLKLFKHKKGINDVSIFMGITCIFFVIGALMPFVDQLGAEAQIHYDTEGLPTDISEEELVDSTDVTIGNIIGSVTKMFVWSWGDFPFWLEIPFIVMRIVLLFILVRNFVPFLSGGG